MQFDEYKELIESFTINIVIETTYFDGYGYVVIYYEDTPEY